jgi:hypothetical protein
MRVLLRISTLLLFAAAMNASVMPLYGQTTNTTTRAIAELNLGLMSLLAEPLSIRRRIPSGYLNAVKPRESDPGSTNLVQAAWLDGIGCPMNACLLPTRSRVSQGRHDHRGQHPVALVTNDEFQGNENKLWEVNHG